MTVRKSELDIADFISFRRKLHQFPEVSGNEYETKKQVQAFMAQFKPDQVLEVGKTGLIFRFDGAKPGKSIMIRCELDALPIQEINEFEHQSTISGVSHKCGHDGHSVILARLASLIAKNRPAKGTIYLLYQPAEENGMGAKEVMEDAQFQKLKIDAVIALHNVPGFPLNQILIKPGAMTPAVSSIIVKFKGKTSHAAEPEKGFNPAQAMAEYIQGALLCSNPDVNQADFFLVTPIFISMGELSYGVSAGYGEVHLTIRAWDNQLLKEKSNQLEYLAKEITKRHLLEPEISWTQEFKANINDPQMVDLIKSAAQQLEMKIVDLDNPMKWGEDFGLFTEHYKGAMFGLGSGENCPALHNPDYDFPDELIETGSAIFKEIITQFLDEK